jgi:hypothetical protein
MVATVIFKIETAPGVEQTVILSQVESDKIKELEYFANQIAQACDAIVKALQE